MMPTILSETRDETMGGKCKMQTGGTRGLLLTVLHADLYSSNDIYILYSLDYRCMVNRKRGDTENGETALAVCGVGRIG
jgi:hypothetical protein